MPTQAEIYGYGTLANILCCVCSLGGAVVLPCARKYHRAYHVVMSVFMGLAVGTLGSDALLHLIPEALDLHSHEEDEHHENETGHKEEEHENEIHVEAYVWYMMVTMGGIYGFYLLEMVMTFIQNRSIKEKDESSAVISAYNLRVMPETNGSTTKLEESTHSNGTLDNKIVVDTDDHTSGFTPLALMVIVGDAVHNFADGLAIAASFTVGILEGVATTIAIFCHELPHELGDFAILLTSGMGFCKALLANLLSSLTALIGFYVGVPVSTEKSARQYIFAITAGMFLYISLVDMYPQLTKYGSRSVKTFLYHNIGIILGAAVIVLLAIFEDHIKI